MGRLHIFYFCLWCPVYSSELESAIQIKKNEKLDGEVWVDGVRYVRSPLSDAIQAGDCRTVSMEEEERAAFGTGAFYFNALMTLLCICGAATAAGLTMGLVSLEPFDMEILLKARPEDCASQEEAEELEREKTYANRVLPLVKNHHRLLVTLLLVNSIANEALPLFLDRLVPSWVAVLLSVTFVLVFGEIIPSAVFTGPRQLEIGSKFAPFVMVLQMVLYLVVYPFAKLLDIWLGEEHKGRYNKAELKALVHSLGNPSHGTGGQKTEKSMISSALSPDEVSIMSGALELSRLKVEDVMLPLDRVFMVHMDDVLDVDRLAQIVASGHSRVPVYDGHPHNIRGVLMVKRLIVISPSDNRKVRSLGLRPPIVVSKNAALMDLLNDFQTGRSHLALVTDAPWKVTSALRSDRMIPPDVHMAGIITLEDVLERLLKEEIRDETDYSVRSTLANIAFRAKRVARLTELANEAKKRVARRHSGSGLRIKSQAQPIARHPGILNKDVCESLLQQP